jgi:putative phage-type endonuclease
MSKQAIPVLGWGTNRDEYLAARRQGLGASDVSAVLGFSKWTTPWQVWAERLDMRRPDDTPSEAADLGTDLEPWLIGQAARQIGQPVVRTPARLYAHPEHQWRMCSPDGTTGTGPLVETKTAGLASGFGIPDGWTDEQIPLGYELQARWQMHVMDAPAVHVVALIAGMGVRHYVIKRDLVVEADLVTQVSQWWQRHVVDRVEPPLGTGDRDTLQFLYPRPTAGEVDLDHTDATELIFQYLEAHEREVAAKVAKEEAGTGLKALLGKHEAGRIGGRVVVTWSARSGRVNWQRLATDLAETHALVLPDPDDYRAPQTRSLSVKEMA